MDMLTADLRAPAPVTCTGGHGSGRTNTAPFYCVLDRLKETARRRGIAPHSALYSTVDSLYQLYQEDNPDGPVPTENAFRSALGRVFPGPLRKHPGGLIGLTAPGIPTVNIRALRAAAKARVGEERRAQASVAPDVAELREYRVKLKEERLQSGVEPGRQPPAALATFRYMDEFLQLSCGTDILSAKLFPNGKEMAESMAAYSAMRDYLLFRRDCPEMNHRPYHENGVLHVADPTVTVVCVGDGHTPRTAGLFAYRTNWKCVSIDPALRTHEGRPWAGIARLDERPQRVQDAEVHVIEEDSPVVVIAWHAHVSVNDALSCLFFDGKRWDVEDKELSRRLRRRVALITCPCCQFECKQRVMPDGSPPDVEYEDLHVPGNKRNIRVWRFASSA